MTSLPFSADASLANAFWRGGSEQFASQGTGDAIYIGDQPLSSSSFIQNEIPFITDSTSGTTSINNIPTNDLTSLSTDTAAANISDAAISQLGLDSSGNVTYGNLTSDTFSEATSSSSGIQLNISNDGPDSGIGEISNSSAESQQSAISNIENDSSILSQTADSDFGPTSSASLSAIEGGADFLAPHAWQIEQKTGIVIHGGRGASCVPVRVGFNNQILFQNNRLRYARHPKFSTTVNKTG